MSADRQRPPPKSAREGLVTAVVVALLVFVVLYFGLGAGAGESLLVVVLFSVLSVGLDLVRGRYRRD